VRRAHASMMLEKYTDALRDLDQALELEARCADAYVGRGAIYLRLKDEPRALEEFGRALELDPASALAHAHRGRIYRTQGKFALASKDLDRAIALDPTCGIAYYYRGLIAMRQQKHAAAISDLDSATRCMQDNPFAHAALATVLATCADRKLRDGKRAVHHATQACRLTDW